jgi:DNA-binding transcriptional LysR family regulator
VFDELKQSIRDIEFLSDATTGEVRIGSMEAPWFTLLPDVIRRFSLQYPRIEVHTDLIDHSEVFLALRERRYDCVLMTMYTGYQDKVAVDDLTVEILYDDAQTVTAWAQSKWARRHKIDLAELIDEPWVMAGPTAWGRSFTDKAFETAGLSPPNPRIATSSIVLRARLIVGSPYLGMFWTSVVRRLIADHYALTSLRVDVRAPSWSVAIVTVKNRTLSPVVERFLACVREVVASLDGKPGGRAVRPRARRPNGR